MSEGPKNARWCRSIVWSNALIILLTGPVWALLFYAIGWMVNRPEPIDVVFLLVWSAAWGFAIGAAASISYLAYSGAKRLRREWLRFRLRTLFVLLTVVGILGGWLMAQASWIRERHAFEAEQSAMLTEATGSTNWGKGFTNRFITRDKPTWISSATLWAFGEDARDRPTFFFWGELRDDDLDCVERLFPEATRIHCLIMPEATRTSP